MLKVINKEWDDFNEEYIFGLENGEKIHISERNYDKIMLHVSTSGKTYKAVVNEHEDNFEEPVEYIGFELLGE